MAGRGEEDLVGHDPGRELRLLRGRKAKKKRQDNVCEVITEVDGYERKSEKKKKGARLTIWSSPQPGPQTGQKRARNAAAPAFFGHCLTIPICEPAHTCRALGRTREREKYYSPRAPRGYIVTSLLKKKSSPG